MKSVFIFFQKINHFYSDTDNKLNSYHNKKATKKSFDMKKKSTPEAHLRQTDVRSEQNRNHSRDSGNKICVKLKP